MDKLSYYSLYYGCIYFHACFIYVCLPLSLQEMIALDWTTSLYKAELTLLWSQQGELGFIHAVAINSEYNSNNYDDGNINYDKSRQWCHTCNFCVE